MKKTSTKALLSLLLSFIFLLSVFPTPSSALSTTTPTVMYPGQTISLNTSGFGSTANSWIGFYKVDSADTQYISWNYLSSLTDGIYTVTAPSELGTYNFRIFYDSGYTKTSTSDSIQVIQYTPAISLNKTSFLPNESIIATFSGGSVINNAWIGFYNADASDSQYRTWEYVSGTSGTYTIAAPNEPGTYQIRLFMDFGYTRIGISQNITVSLFTPTLSTSASSALPGGKVTAYYSNASTLSNAWIGLYRTGAEDTAYIMWDYTDGNTSGSYEVTLPSETGTYEFRIFNDFGYTRLATSSPIVVGSTVVPTTTPAPTPTPTLTPTPVPTTIAPPTTTIVQPEVFDSGVRLSWPSSSNAIGYRLFRSTLPYDDGISVTDFYLTSISYADVNVEPNTTYYYTVYPVLAEADPYQGIEESLGSEIATYTITTGSKVISGIFKNFIMLQLDNPYLTKNGIKEEIDPGKGTAPMILSGRTVVPIRAIVEAMGGNITWDGNTRKITLSARGNVVEMWVDKKDLFINGVKSTMDVAPTIVNGRTFVPVRFAAENLNCKVDWINSTKEAIIVYED